MAAIRTQHRTVQAIPLIPVGLGFCSHVSSGHSVLVCLYLGIAMWKGQRSLNISVNHEQNPYLCKLSFKGSGNREMLWRVHKTNLQPFSGPNIDKL